MDKPTDKKDGATRRAILTAGAVAAPAAALAAATGRPVEAAEPDLASERMQDTAHTRAYYDTARF